MELQANVQLREYDYRLLEETAKVMQQVWNQRRVMTDVDINCAANWLRIERKIWKFIEGISGKEKRHRWQDRVGLIRHIEANYQPASASSPGFPPPLVPNDASATNGESDPEKIEQALASLINDMATTHASSTIDGDQKLLRERAADGVERLTRTAIRRLSAGYAAAWQTLEDWLEREAEHEQFQHALQNVPQLTRRAPAAVGRRKLPV